MYSFRVPISLTGGRPDTDDDELVLFDSETERIWFQAPGPLKDASRITFRGSGYATPDAAERRGTHLCFALRLAALRAGVGLDFMERQSFLSLSSHALEAANAAAPENVRAINEHAGVHVHRTDEQLVTFEAHGVGHISTPRASVVSHFEDALREAVPTERARLAFDLYSQSSHARGTDARFLTLVSAVEALVAPGEVPAEEQELLAELARQIENSSVIEDLGRRAAMANRVRGLRRETVRSAGLRLVQQLEPRRYAGMTPVKFFDRVYELRSRLSHGDAPPWRDVGDVASDLWLFVRDLIDSEFTAPTVAGD
ncbi:MAG: hypothetical protein CVT61_13875 [Actinobacteria bacterium HGW-Actinobacteria-11]|nr:MAG: hypothetical protein CVT61_13875 [Actinobacteria bacterium HGW-Actinobacteria-11]